MDGPNPGAVTRSVRLDQQRDDWQVATEVAVEIDVNGQPVTVTMATPADVEELAVGLAYTEGVVTAVEGVTSVNVKETLEGVVADLTVAESAINQQARRARLLEGRSGCGLCGVDTLSAAMRRPSVVAPQTVGGPIADAALRKAFDALPDHQPLNQRTHSVHAAAWCDLEGQILCVREDVGRHNALDKLVGWALLSQAPQGSGFVLLSSRLSFELVCKAAALGASLLAAVSAPTALALEMAETANLPLACLGPGGAIARF